MTSRTFLSFSPYGILPIDIKWLATKKHPLQSYKYSIQPYLKPYSRVNFDEVLGVVFT